MIALLLLKKIISLFLIMLCGALLVKLGILKSSDSGAISRLSIYLVIPVVIVKSFMIDYSPEVVRGLLLSAAAALTLLMTQVLMGRFLRKPLRLDPVEEMSAVYSNAGNLIIPIVTSVLGPEWVMYTSPFICIQLVFMWTHGKNLICGENGFDLKKILTNINVIAAAIGIAFFAFRIRVPGIIGETMSSISALQGPLAMITTGLLIGGMDLKKVFTYKRVMFIAFLRLILFPVVPFMLLKFCGLQSLHPDGANILMISFFATISTSATTITQMARVYEKEAEYASAINVVATLFCMATMPLYVMLYQL
ncbi:MAG: AEC family transporter [Firmicutes bacterium]|nr:AEC family transporter [Bacillota bacterium]